MEKELPTGERNEKSLPLGEAGIEIDALPALKTPISRGDLASVQNPAPADKPSSVHPRVPSVKAQSWGTVISIVVIVLMIVIGAFYAWGKRISQEQTFLPSTGAFE